MSHLEVQILGGFQATHGGLPIPAFASARLQSLLSYFVLNAGVNISRQHLAFLFWPDSNEPQARTNLRQLLHHFRSALPNVDSFVEGDTQILRWRTDAPYSCDACEFERSAAEQDGNALPAWVRAVELYRGDLLPGMYDEWVESHRVHLKERYVAVLNQLVSAYKEANDLAAAIRYASLLVSTDPLSESGYRKLMRLHESAGDHAKALAVYSSCEKILRAELGVDPGPQLRALRDEISERRSAVAVSQPRTEAPRSDSPRVQAADLPLIGRDRELSNILEVWANVRQGHCRVVLVAGDPGLGKTRLVSELAAVSAKDHAAIAEAACYEVEHALPYGPVADILRSSAVTGCVAKLPAAYRSQIGRLLPELRSSTDASRVLQSRGPAADRRDLLHAISEAIVSVSAPLLICIDDLQWCDAETLDWVNYFVRHYPSAPVAIAATARIDELPNGHALLRLLNDWTRLAVAERIDLNPLDEHATADLARTIAAQELKPDASAYVYKQTGGNPLFIVESVRAGLAQQAHSAGSVARSLPPKMTAVISERLNQLTGVAQTLTGVAAAIGRPFDTEILASISGIEEDAVAAAVDELWSRHLLRIQSPGVYDFVHGHVRDTAYRQMGPARSRLLHRRVASTLESVHSRDLDSVCDQVARHYDLGGAPFDAIRFYLRAAEVVRRRYANREAIAYLQHALELLPALPAGLQRDDLELSILLALGPPLIAVEGYASSETGRVYTRARLVCELNEYEERYFPVLSGSATYHVVRGELQAGKEVAQRHLLLATAKGDPSQIAAGHFATGCVQFHLGDLQGSQANIKSAVELHTSSGTRMFDYGPELGIFTGSYLSQIKWLRGDAAAGCDGNRDLLAQAEALGHPFSLALALAYTAVLHQFRDEPDLAEQRSLDAANVCRRYEFRYYLSWTPIVAGWARTRRGDLDGIDAMKQGYADLTATGARLRAPFYLGLIAQAYASAQQFRTALDFLSRAFEAGNSAGELWFHSELERTRGDILLARGERSEATAAYRRAVRTAQQMGIVQFERSASASLAAAV